MKNSKEQYIVRIAGKFNSVDALRNLIIGKSKTGGELRLSDIAEIEDGSKDVQNFSRINGVTLSVFKSKKQGDANAVEVSKLVRTEIASLENENKEANLKFDVAQDGSIFTINAANAVKEDLLIAVIPLLLL